MAQLVGQTCVLCGKRISLARDARFCDACRCPVHTACVSSKPNNEHCSSCGADPPAMEAHTARARQDDADHQAVLRDHLIKLGVFSIGGGLVLVFVAVLSIVQAFPGGAFLVLTVPLGIVGVLMVVRGFLQILRATVWRGRMTEKTLSRWAR